MISARRAVRNLCGHAEISLVCSLGQQEWTLQDAQKGGLLTHPTPTCQDAPFIGQDRSEEDLHPNLLKRDLVVVRNRISSTGDNETSLNRFEHGRDRCAENRNIEFVPCLIGKWRESFVHVVIA